MSLRPSERAELRRSSFKPSVDADEGRRRRVGFTVDIRKRSRDSALQKTRRAAAGGEAAPLARSQQPSPVPGTRLGSIPAHLAEGLVSGDISVQVEAVREFRKLLSIDDNTAVLILVKLLSSPSEDVREQILLVVWALGNMASNAIICRGLILVHGALFPVLQQFCGNVKLSMLQKASWALTNICYCLSQAGDFEHVKSALPVLRQLIHSQDVEVLSHACRALSYLSDGGNDNIQAVIEGGTCPQLAELLNHSSPSVLIPVLHVIGNIVSIDDSKIQCIIDLQALPYLCNLLTTNQNKGIKPEVCRIISNIMAGNKEQIQSVINGNMVGPLVHLMHTAEFGVKYEAAWAIANAASRGTHDQNLYLVSQGCIKAFCDLLSYTDTSILMVCLEGLDDILKAGEADKSPWGCNVNMYAKMIEDNEWLDKIENLQNHDNSRIVEMAACLLKSYWSNEDKDIPMLWYNATSWLAEDNTPDFSFFAGPGDCDFG